MKSYILEEKCLFKVREMSWNFDLGQKKTGIVIRSQSKILLVRIFGRNKTEISKPLEFTSKEIIKTVRDSQNLGKLTKLLESSTVYTQVWLCPLHYKKV